MATNSQKASHSFSIQLKSPMIFAAVVVIATAAGLACGIGILTPLVVISIVTVTCLLLLPWFFQPLAIVVLIFSGRFELGIAASYPFDVAFWAALGLLPFLLSPQAISGRRRIPHNTGFALFVCFLGFVALSIFPTIGSEYGTEKAFRVLFYGPIFFILAQVAYRSADDVERFFVCFIAFITAFATISLILTILSYGFSGIQRITPPGGGPITLARLTGLAAIACIGLAMYHPRRGILLASSFYLAIITFMTGSRAPFIFLVVALVFVPLLALINSRTRKMAISIASLLVIAAIISVPLWNYASSRDLPFANRFSLITSDKKGVSVDSREEFYSTAIRISQEYNGIGQGIGSWSQIVFGNDEPAYPHNVFLEILVEQGLAAMIVFVAFLAWILWRALKALMKGNSSYKHLSLSIASILSLVYSVMVAQTSGDLYDNRYIWFYAGLTLACITICQQDEGDIVAHADALGSS